MKIFYNIFLLLYFTTNITFSQWYVQESGTIADLRGVWFADSLNGWICGDSGIVLHTSNGGQVWERQNSTVNVKLEDVFFWDLQTGWIVGDSGTVIQTTDRGLSWSELQIGVTNQLHEVQFVSLQKGFISGVGIFLYTNDGGTTWQADTSSGNSAYISFFWLNEAVGSILLTYSSYPIQVYTFDEGLTWSVAPLGTLSALWDVWGYYGTSRDFYWDVGENGTTVWLDVWAPQYSFAYIGQTEDTLDLHAVTLERDVEPLKLWSVGNQGWIISSVDTGLTWQTITSDVTVDLYEVSFPSKNNGWVVGDSGVILSYNNPTVVENSSASGLSSSTQIHDPYPNPFNSMVTIRFSVAETDNISLEIFNTLGQKVRTIYSGYKERGNYEQIWDGRDEQGEVCSTGVYLTVIKIQSYLQSKKIILLK